MVAVPATARAATAGIWPGLLKDAALVALVAAALAIFLVGFRTTDLQGRGLEFVYRLPEVGIAVAMIFVGRLCLALADRGLGIVAAAGGLLLIAAAAFMPWPSQFLQIISGLAGGALALRAAWSILAGTAEGGRQIATAGASLGALARALAPWFSALMFLGALLLPFLPSSDQKVMDLAILILTYVMLGWGLNIVVGLAGLLDLGYVAFYAVGAYTYALLSTQQGLGFWACLPMAGIFAAMFGVLLGFPVLRLRGDYLAIVTLGFGEIIRLVLLNWVDLTNGPAGVGSIPGPSFLGAVFAETAPEGGRTFHQMMGIEFSSNHRLIFLYFLILVLALVTNLFTLRIRRLPVGRAWEALREDEIASRALGINPTNTKLTAFAIGAMFAGFAGSFFAAKQRFVSPESFVFIESAIILAIVVLGGMGSQIGVVLAAILLIGLPEWFRGLGEYRMLAFGLAMVLIMIYRPRGLVSHREPTIRLHSGKGRP